MPRQLALEFPLRPAFGRTDFLVAPCNQLAVDWIDRWPAWPSHVLVLHGTSGCGKSHLLSVWRDQTGARLLDGKAPDGLDLAELSKGGAVAVDNADELASEAALFHLFNGVKETGGSLLLTAKKPPARWRLQLPDLISRLNSVPEVAIELPDDGLLSALLVKLFADRQVAVGADVINYLVPRMDRSFGSALELVSALDGLALSRGRRIGLTLARDALAECTRIGS